MTSTKDWAAANGICIDERAPAVHGSNGSHSRTGSEVAARAIILHCVAAVGYGVDAPHVAEWLTSEGLWSSVSPKEQVLLSGGPVSERDRNAACWRQESEWTLLWAIGKVESLGLPTRTCDTRRLVDEIMPALGDSTAEFISTAELRSPGELLGEDDRAYTLHCLAIPAHRTKSLPDDLLSPVLFERCYAFEWIGDTCGWDDVTVDT